MKTMVAGVIGFLFLCSVSFPGGATTIAFDVTNVSGNSYQYNYTVTNDTLSVAIEQFAIRFDVNLFQNLRLASAPAGWDPLAIQPDPILSDDGFYDVLALTSPGIAVGATLAGFSVQVDFLGAGAPGSQAFDVLNPLTFAVIDDGFTVRSGTVVVTEPGGLGLMALGLFALAAVVRRRRSSCS